MLSRTTNGNLVCRSFTSSIRLLSDSIKSPSFSVENFFVLGTATLWFMLLVANPRTLEVAVNPKHRWNTKNRDQKKILNVTEFRGIMFSFKLRRSHRQRCDGEGESLECPTSSSMIFRRWGISNVLMKSFGVIRFAVCTTSTTYVCVKTACSKTECCVWFTNDP